MKPICSEKILLIFLEHMVQLGVKVLNLFTGITKQLTDTPHIVEMSALWYT